MSDPIAATYQPPPCRHCGQAIHLGHACIGSLAERLEISNRACDAELAAAERCAGERDALAARLAAAETQIAVMRDEEAQRVKLKAMQMLFDKDRQEADAKSRAAMESIGISTHWSYNAGKTVGAMTLELVELVKALRAKPPTTNEE